MKFQNALIPVALVAIVALAAYFVVGNKMVDQEQDTNADVMVNDPSVNTTDNTQSGNEGDVIDEEVEDPVDPELPDPANDEVQARDEEASETATDVVTADLDYQDGTYQQRQTYTVPNGTTEWVDVTVTVSNDTVSSLNLSYSGIEGGSKNWQGNFDGAINDLVIGQNLGDISLSRVGGASLTTPAFNQALEQIKDQAQA